MTMKYVMPPEKVFIWDSIPEKDRYPLALLTKLVEHATTSNSPYWTEISKRGTRVDKLKKRLAAYHNPGCSAAARSDFGGLYSDVAEGTSRRLFFPCYNRVAPGEKFCHRHGGKVAPTKRVSNQRYTPEERSNRRNKKHIETIKNRIARLQSGLYLLVGESE